MQVADALTPVGRSVGVFLKTAVGGVPYDRQMEALRRGVEVIVATPGRLGDLIDRGVCSLDSAEITVLDEGDQMADMGFLPEVTELLAKTPENAQRLLFSATLDGDVDELVKRFMHDPVTHSTAPAEASVSTMDHYTAGDPAAGEVPDHRRDRQPGRQDDRLRPYPDGCRSSGRAARAVGVRAGRLHGGKTQRVRTRTLAEFTEGARTSWSRRTSPPAASTSTASRWSCTWIRPRTQGLPAPRRPDRARRRVRGGGHAGAAEAAPQHAGHDGQGRRASGRDSVSPGQPEARGDHRSP
jgi:hypothetical protein